MKLRDLATCVASIALVFSLACGDTGENAARRATFRDSAGIRIVDNPGIQYADSTSWTIDTSRVLTIGSVDGAKELLFTSIRGLTRLDDGRIVVGDQKTSELRYFDSTGKYLSTAGGIGDGPGEYVNFYTLRRVGDSLLIGDYEGMRAHRTDLDGRYARRFRPRMTGLQRDPLYDAPDLVGVFSDGTLLLKDHRANCMDLHVTGGVCEDSSRFARVRESGEIITDFGNMVSGREWVAKASDGKSVYLDQFRPAVYTAVGGDFFYFADAAHAEVRVYHKDGALVRIYRLGISPQAFVHEPRTVPPLPANAPASVAQQYEDARKYFARVSEAMQGADRPAHRPAYTGIILDRALNLWIREDNGIGPSRQQRFLVVDTAGVVRYRVAIPQIGGLAGGLIVIPSVHSRWRGEIGDNYLLGVAIDLDQVEYARMLRLIKKPTPP